MIKKILKQILRDGKDYLLHLKYKNGLPRNPMHDDIYLVAYPKSGVTWLQHIIGNIELNLADKDEIITFYNHHKYSPDIYQIKYIKVNRFLDRTFIKSHEEFNPYYYFVVYLIRNPYDAMVSYYNFLLNYEYKLTFEEFVKSSNGITAWKKHVSSWLYKNASAQRIHIIKYEDLIKNSENEIRKLYKNFGLEISNDILNKALLNSSLNSMSGSENHYKENNPKHTLYFVGEKNKINKNELLTNEIVDYINFVVKDEINDFYPEL